MSDLGTLSLQRAGLPVFPGATIPEQLINAHDAAFAVLQKYVPNLAVNAQAAQQTLDQIAVWEERNRSALTSALSDPNSSELPDAIRISFGADKAQQFIIACFTQAAVGLGPWMSGAVGTEAAKGGTINADWASADSQTRLQVFGSIVKMDQDGYLEKLFVPPSGTSGFGIAPILIWAVVVVLVTVAASILLYLYSAKRLDQNNRLMRDMCEKAQASGDAATVEQCVKATEGLQQLSLVPGIDSIAGSVWKVLAIIGVAWVAIEFGVPMLERGMSQDRERTSRSR